MVKSFLFTDINKLGKERSTDVLKELDNQFKTPIGKIMDVIKLREDLKPESK